MHKESNRPVALTQQELESRLLSATNSRRGPVDPADFKQYVFPLLFLKRLSDNWDAERSQAEKDYAPHPVPAAASADYHRFHLPNGCRWSDLRRADENVGYALQLLLDPVQEANPTTLGGIFSEVAWLTAYEAFPDSSYNTLSAIEKQLSRDVYGEN